MTRPWTCGSLDASQHAVELRSYATVRAQYEERFNQPFDISAEDYAKLCKDLQVTLTVRKYTVTVEAAETTDKRAQLTRSVSVSLAPKTRAPLLNVVLLGAVALINRRRRAGDDHALITSRRSPRRAGGSGWAQT